MYVLYFIIFYFIIGQGFHSVISRYRHFQISVISRYIGGRIPEAKIHFDPLPLNGIIVPQGYGFLFFFKFLPWLSADGSTSRPWLSSDQRYHQEIPRLQMQMGRFQKKKEKAGPKKKPFSHCYQKATWRCPWNHQGLLLTRGRLRTW